MNLFASPGKAEKSRQRGPQGLNQADKDAPFGGPQSAKSAAKNPAAAKTGLAPTTRSAPTKASGAGPAANPATTSAVEGKQEAAGKDKKSFGAKLKENLIDKPVAYVKSLYNRWFGKKEKPAEKASGPETGDKKQDTGLAPTDPQSTAKETSQDKGTDSEVPSSPEPEMLPILKPPVKPEEIARAREWISRLATLAGQKAASPSALLDGMKEGSGILGDISTWQQEHADSTQEEVTLLLADLDAARLSLSYQAAFAVSDHLAVQLTDIHPSNYHADSDSLTLPEAAIQLTPRHEKLAFLSGTLLNVTGITFSRSAIDWAEAAMPLGGKVLSLSDNIQFTVPQIIVKGSAENYNFEFQDAKGEVSAGDYFKASGTFSARFDNAANKLELMEATLALEGESPEIPGEIPGVWPLQFDFIFPLAAVGIPAEAGIGIYANGHAKGGLSGEVTYTEGGTWEVKGQPSLSGELAFGVKASAGLGSRLVVYIGLFLAGEAKAQFDGKIDLSAKFAMDPETHEFGKMETDASYTLAASLMLALKGGVEAKALYVFGGTLYEIVFKEWQIGETEISGKLPLLGSEEPLTIEGRKGMLSGNSTAFRDPAKAGAVRLSSKAEKGAFDTLAEATELLGSLGEKEKIKAFLGKKGRVSEDETKAIQDKVLRVFNASATTAKKNVTALKKEWDAKKAAIDKPSVVAKVVSNRADRQKEAELSEGKYRSALDELRVIEEKYAELQKLYGSGSGVPARPLQVGPLAAVKKR